MIPEGIVDSEWDRIERRLEDMSVVFDRWQTNLGELILGLTADGKYAATVGGVTLSIPRQVGKTFTIGILIVALCVEFPGLVVLWTAHHGRTTTKTFRSIQGVVKRKRVAPHLAVGGGIRTANGEQEIAFRNGSIIMFGAREHGFGRGIDAVDVIVFDEAQILGEKALEDMVATTNQSRHEHGALLFYMGTPPRPEDNGEAFESKRSKALAGTSSNAVYVECSADPDADPDDRRQWAIANPSFPHHTPVEAMERMRENLPSDESWRLEAYGIWPNRESVEQKIKTAAWKSLEISESRVPTDKPVRYALTMSPERHSAIAVAIPGELVDFLDLAEMGRLDDSRKTIDWLAERKSARMAVMIDSRDPAAAFINELRTRGVKVNATTQGDAGKACMGLLTAVEERRIAHIDQPAIRAALKIVRTKPIGKAGLWEWDLDDPAPEVAALRAMTLAHFGLSLNKRRSGGRSSGGRKAVVM